MPQAAAPQPLYALYSPEKAAKFIGKSQSWLAKSRMSGLGPRFVKAGLNVRYDVNDLAAWIEANKFASNAEYGASSQGASPPKNTRKRPPKRRPAKSATLECEAL